MTAPVSQVFWLCYTDRVPWLESSLFYDCVLNYWRESFYMGNGDNGSLPTPLRFVRHTDPDLLPASKHAAMTALCPCTGWETCGANGAFFWRLAINLVQLSCVAAVWGFVPKDRTPLTAFGARTMVPYLLHPYALMLVSHMGLYDVPPLVKGTGWRRGWLTTVVGDSAGSPDWIQGRQLLATVLGGLITVALCTKTAAKLSTPVTNPLAFAKVRRPHSAGSLPHSSHVLLPAHR